MQTRAKLHEGICSGDDLLFCVNLNENLNLFDYNVLRPNPLTMSMRKQKFERNMLNGEWTRTKAVTA